MSTDWPGSSLSELLRYLEKMASDRTESDWQRYREMSEELRSICQTAVLTCAELDSEVRLNTSALGYVEIRRFDRSYIKFLEGQIDLGVRGPEWSDRLRARVHNLSDYVGRDLANCRLRCHRREYWIKVDPVAASIVHWEFYEESE